MKSLLLFLLTLLLTTIVFASAAPTVNANSTSSEVHSDEKTKDLGFFVIDIHDHNDTNSDIIKNEDDEDDEDDESTATSRINPHFLAVRGANEELGDQHDKSVVGSSDDLPAFNFPHLKEINEKKYADLLVYERQLSYAIPTTKFRIYLQTKMIESAKTDYFNTRAGLLSAQKVISSPFFYFKSEMAKEKFRALKARLEKQEIGNQRKWANHVNELENLNKLVADLEKEMLKVKSKIKPIEIQLGWVEKE